MLKKYVKPSAEIKMFTIENKIASNLDSWTTSRGKALGLDDDVLGSGAASYIMASPSGI